MTFLWTLRFEHAYRRLSSPEQAAVDARLRVLEQDWRHPSLHTKKLQGTRHIWAIRISHGLRLTCEPSKGSIFLRNVGPHDPTLRAP